MVFCEDWHFSKYFLRCILLSQIQSGIYKKCFFVQNKVSWNISTMGHVLRLLTFFLTLQVHEIKFFKTFSRGHHHKKWFFCEDWHFSKYFLRCILLSQIQSGIYKKCFFVQNKVSWNISTMGHVLRLLTFFLTLQVHEIKFFKTFSRGHHHKKWFFVRTDIFRNIF